MSQLQTFTVKANRLKDINIYTSQDYFDIVFSDGNYDEEIFSALEKNCPEGKTIYDVGGFMGINSIAFSRLVGENGKVIVFEPNPWNIERIQKNLSCNETEAKNISIEPLAFSNEITKQKMLVSEQIDTGYSSTSQLLSAHGADPQENIRQLGFKEVDVDVTTLDAFVEKTQIVPDFLKVDIEGVEHLFLEGGIKTLQEHSPVLFIEIHSNYCAIKCSSILLKLNYEMRVIKKEKDGRVIILCTRQESSGGTVPQKDFLQSRVEELSFELNEKIDELSKSVKFIESKFKKKSFIKRIFRK